MPGHMGVSEDHRNGEHNGDEEPARIHDKAP